MLVYQHRANYKRSTKLQEPNTQKTHLHIIFTMGSEVWTV